MVDAVELVQCERSIVVACTKGVCSVSHKGGLLTIPLQSPPSSTIMQSNRRARRAFAFTANLYMAR
jgi:hypothetical protein